MRRKSSSTLRVRLVQAMGCLRVNVSKEQFYNMYEKHGGSLWVPGLFGKEVSSKTEVVGSWHWKGCHHDVTVSFLLFSNGKCKMSLGTGSWNPSSLMPKFGSDPWLDFCAYFCTHLTGIATFDWEIKLMSADKTCIQSGYEIRTDILAQEWRNAGRFECVIDPHTFESGRISTVKGYIDEKRLITVDHRGNVHFTGFTSWYDLLYWVQACDLMLANHFHCQNTLFHDET